LLNHLNRIKKNMKKTLPIILVATLAFATACLQPRNTLRDCKAQCESSDKSKACHDFCDCIHKNCQSLEKCLDEYDKSPTARQSIETPAL
jgi:hypothetical protein